MPVTSDEEGPPLSDGERRAFVDLMWDLEPKCGNTDQDGSPCDQDAFFSLEFKGCKSNDCTLMLCVVCLRVTLLALHHIRAVKSACLECPNHSGVHWSHPADARLHVERI